MAVTEEFVEQVSEALDQLGYSVEQEEDVISDVSQIDDDVTLPGIRVQSGTMTGYVSMKLAVLKQYLDNTVQTIQQTWNAWFSDVLPTGVRSIWTTWFGARQTEWDTMSTEVGNATDMAVQAADNADSAAQNAQQKAGVAEDKAAIAAEQAQYAKAEGDYAKTQGDYAKEWNDHPPFIGDGTTGDLNFWYLYDVTTARYVKDAYAKGDDLDYSTMTPEEKSELNDTIVQHIVSDNILGPTYDEDEHGFNFPKAMHVQYDEEEHGFYL